MWQQVKKEKYVVGVMGYQETNLSLLEYIKKVTTLIASKLEQINVLFVVNTFTTQFNLKENCNEQSNSFNNLRKVGSSQRT